MTWNHRVVRRVHNPGTDQEETEYSIHEVFYDENNVPFGLTREAETVTAFESWEKNPIESLRWTLNRMLEALDNPVLDYDTRKEVEIGESIHNE
jgi:hypothetical protein